MNGICKIADAVYAMEKAIKERLELKTGKPEKKGDRKKKKKKKKRRTDKTKKKELQKQLKVAG